MPDPTPIDPRAGILLALTDPVPGREADYDEWYTQQHMRDALRLPGFVDGQRFVLDHGDDPLHRYLALYHVSDVALASRSLRQAREERDAAGRRDDPTAFFHVPPVVAPGHRGWWMRPITPVVRAG